MSGLAVLKAPLPPQYGFDSARMVQALGDKDLNPPSLPPLTRASLMPLAAEFAGTCFFVIASLCITKAVPEEWAPAAIGCTLTVLMSAVTGTSGGHLNPAVTLSSVLTGRTALSTCTGYCAVQLLAGALGGLSFGFVIGGGRPLGPLNNFSIWEAGAVEGAYTTVLCLAALGSSRARKPAASDDWLTGVAVGFTVLAAGYACGLVSGTCLNPALDLAFLLAAGAADATVPGRTLAEYVLCQVAGAVLASGLYRLLVPEDFAAAGESQALASTDEDATLPKRATAELVGAAAVAMTAGLVALGDSPAGSVAVGVTLMCMILALGDISGGHFNPAVTMAMVCRGRQKLTPNEGLAYIGSQLLGGLIGATCASLAHGGTTLQLTPSLSDGYLATGTVEAVFTGVLAFVVLSTSTADEEGLPARWRLHQGLAAGIAVATGGCAVRQLSGAIFNPAVAFGFSSLDASNLRKFMKFFLYGLAEMAGGLVGGVLSFATRPKEYVPALERKIADA